MARALTAKDLKMIDELAAFVTQRERNDELVRVMLKLMTVAKVPGRRRCSASVSASC